MTPFDNNPIMYVVYVDDYHVSPVIELSFSYVTHTACRLLLQYKAMKMRKCTNSICNIEISIIFVLTMFNYEYVACTLCVSV